jgi:hypothetical protein
MDWLYLSPHGAGVVDLNHPQPNPLFFNLVRWMKSLLAGVNSWQAFTDYPSFGRI